MRLSFKDLQLLAAADSEVKTTSKAQGIKSDFIFPFTDRIGFWDTDSCQECCGGICVDAVRLFIPAGAVTLSWRRICQTPSPVGGSSLQRPGLSSVLSAMDEGTASETVPDLKDIEVKIGRKTPDGLLRWMREEASSYRGDAKLSNPQDGGKETGMMSLDEKIRKLKVEMVSACVCACALLSGMKFSEGTTVLTIPINDKLVLIN